MRVAFFVPSFPETSETFILRQVVGLLDRGHEVRIFAYRAASGGPVPEAVRTRRLEELVRVLPNRRDEAASAEQSSAPGVRESGQWPSPSLRVVDCLRQHYADRLGGWRTLFRTLATLSGERPFDVVHCHYGDVGLRYAVAGRLWRAPLIVSFYGYDGSVVPRERGARIYEPLFAETGAVTVCLPQDVQTEAYDYPAPFFEKRVWRVQRTVPPVEQLQRAVEAIGRAKNPVIIAGDRKSVV